MLCYVITFNNNFYQLVSNQSIKLNMLMILLKLALHLIFNLLVAVMMRKMVKFQFK